MNPLTWLRPLRERCTFGESEDESLCSRKTGLPPTHDMIAVVGEQAGMRSVSAFRSRPPGVSLRQAQLPPRSLMPPR